MKQLAPDLWQLRGFPPNGINVYLAGDVLIDAATRRAGRRILRQVEDRPLSLVALTHVHPDHQGAVQQVCEARGVPLACHADDVDAMEGRRPVQEKNRVRQPPDTFTLDPVENRRSIRKLCDLRPSLVCVGHGSPLRNVATLERLVERLPD